MSLRGDRRVIRADLHQFSDFERAARSVLLAENLTDTELYEGMGRALVAQRGWRVQLAFQRLGGGGSTTAEMFRRVAADGRIVLAIADSDRTYPGGGRGDTANRLDSRGLPGYQRAVILHVRAAENLLAFELYEEALAPHPCSPSIPERLLALHRAVPPSVLPWREHVDLKSGLRLARVREMVAGSAEEALWSELSRRVQRDRCLREIPCREEAECDCFVVEAIGRNALERAVVWMRGQHLKHLAKLLGLARDARLTELCEEVVAWGLAPAGIPS